MRRFPGDVAVRVPAVGVGPICQDSITSSEKHDRGEGDERKNVKRQGEVKGQILSKKEFYLVIRKEKQFRSLKLNLISAKVSDSCLPGF